MYIKSILGLSIGLGVLAGILIIIGDYLLAFFTDIPPIITTSSAPIWQGFLASFYGGINEELLMRLFFMSLLIWLFSKIKKTDEGKPTQLSIWLAIFLAAILFGLIHLPLYCLDYGNYSGGHCTCNSFKWYRRSYFWMALLEKRIGISNYFPFFC